MDNQRRERKCLKALFGGSWEAIIKYQGWRIGRINHQLIGRLSIENWVLRLFISSSYLCVCVRCKAPPQLLDGMSSVQFNSIKLGSMNKVSRDEPLRSLVVARRAISDSIYKRHWMKNLYLISLPLVLCRWGRGKLASGHSRLSSNDCARLSRQPNRTNPIP